MSQAIEERAQQRPLYAYDAMSAKVLRLYYEEQDLINAMSASDIAVSEHCGRKPIGGDVEYLADGAIEKGVDFRSRLVLAVDPPSGRALLNALKDCIARLADTVPNRPDVLESLSKAIDVDGLLTQMLSRRDVTTAQDILEGCLQPLISVLQSFQAVHKSELTAKWWDGFQQTCQGYPYFIQHMC